MKSLSRVWLCDPTDCSPPGSSVHGIFQARTVEWVAISFSRGSSRPRDWTWVSSIAGRLFTLWAFRGAHSHERCTDTEAPRRDRDATWDSSAGQRGRPGLESHICLLWASLMTQKVKNLPAKWETWVRSLGQEDLLEKKMASHSSVLAWRISQTEEPGGLQAVGSQGVRHNGATNAFTLLCFSLALWPQVSYSTSLCLYFPSAKWE